MQPNNSFKEKLAVVAVKWGSYSMRILIVDWNHVSLKQQQQKQKPTKMEQNYLDPGNAKDKDRSGISLKVDFMVW